MCKQTSHGSQHKLEYLFFPHTELGNYFGELLCAFKEKKKKDLCILYLQNIYPKYPKFCSNQGWLQTQTLANSRGCEAAKTNLSNSGIGSH